jgi:gluconokinase
MSHPVPGLRSPYDTVDGLVYFGRMLDKIRLHAAGRLPGDYLENLGAGFDGRACTLLGVSYHDLKTRALEGGSDESILAWCRERGRKCSESEVEIWNDFLRKRGWRDATSDRLAQRLRESGLANRRELVTFFDLIEVDEGRPPRNPEY